MSNEHISGVLEHKKLVGFYLNKVTSELFKKAIEHDDSKFSDEELRLFEEVTPKLKKSEFGSEEYKNFLKELKPALDHHYKVNRHHPEHFQNGINDMNLMDVIEMVCDWMAAVKRHENGDIYKSLEVCKERFKIDAQLFSILKNTVEFFENSEV